MGSISLSSGESVPSTRCPTPGSNISLSTPLSSSSSLAAASMHGEDLSQNGLQNYISLGCLHLNPDSLSTVSVPTRSWSEITPSLVTQWSELLGPDALKLLKAGWIRIFYRFNALETRSCATIRMYLRSLDSFADRANKPLKSRLRSLLQRVDTSPQTWAGQHDHAKEPQRFDLWATGEDESLFYLFNTIRSPDPQSHLISCPYSNQAAEYLLDSSSTIESHRPIQGLKTRMYEFQTKSAALMVQREAEPQKILDPRFEPRYSPDHRVYYYNARDMEFILKPQYYESNRGGILAETMGIGKTLICLSVILATKGHLPYIPPGYQGGKRTWGRLSHVGERSLARQTSSSRYPFAKADALSGAIAQPQATGISQPLGSGSISTTYYGSDDYWEVGTLAKMAAATVTRNSIPWKVRFPDKDDECYKILDAAVPSYDVPIEQARKNRSNVTNMMQKWTLCSATLVVVPPNLLTQWQSEIKKHVADGHLKVLVLDNKYGNKVPGPHEEGEDIFCTKLLPSSDVLRTYDIVLFSRPRFEQEIKDGADSNGRRQFAGAPTICQCPYIGATRKPDCRCFRLDQTYLSPLMKLHWLRMIIDEGHNFSSAKSNAVLVAGQIKADRRWVVSGTPAKDLVSVDVELPVMDEQEVISREAVMEKKRQYIQSDDQKVAAKSLGDLAKNFLKVQPWAVCNWEEYIYRHESNTHRTYTGFSACMRQTLSGLVIKTTPEVYEKEVSIPELIHTTVRLKPTWYDKMSANLFIHVLRANAITSERAGVDYLFDKSSVKAKHSMLRNLRQSNFTWTGFTESIVRNSIEECHRYFNKEDRNCSQQDDDLLRESLNVIEQVLGSPRWLDLGKAHEMGLFVEAWPQEAIEAFALGQTADPQMIGVTQLLEGQSHVNSQVAADDDPSAGLARVGEIGKEKIEEAEKREQEDEAKRKRSTEKEAALSSKAVPSSCVDGEPSTTKRSLPIRTLPSPKKASQPTQGNPSDAGEPKSPVRQKRKLTLSDHTKDLPTDSPLLKTSVIGTTSSKLSYVIDRVMEFQDEHKIIVFYDGNNAAYYIAQCLDFLHIGHRIYARTLDSRSRDKYIQLFKESPTIRVLLMDIACGSHGLDLHVASVVLIINPINRKDTEGQAIKRAHRIGQTKKVIVETLILEGTIEEAIFDAVVERTQNMRQDDELQKTKTIEDDLQIQSIIQNAQIVPVELGEAEGERQMARLKVRQQVFARPNRAKYDGACESGSVGDKEEKRKKKRVKGAKKAKGAEETRQVDRTIFTTTAATIDVPASTASASTMTHNLGTVARSLFGGPVHGVSG